MFKIGQLWKILHSPTKIKSPYLVDVYGFAKV